MILKISEQMQGTISKLDKYNNEDCKKHLSKEEFLAKSASLDRAKETARKELGKWLETLNDFSVSKDEWKRTANESKIGIRGLESELDKFKNDLLPQNFDEFREEIENDFGKLEINLAHNLRYNLREKGFFVKIQKKNIKIKIEIFVDIVRILIQQLS
jgi:hypothetical protein